MCQSSCAHQQVILGKLGLRYQSELSHHSIHFEWSDKYPVFSELVSHHSKLPQPVSDGFFQCRHGRGGPRRQHRLYVFANLAALYASQLMNRYREHCDSSGSETYPVYHRQRVYRRRFGSSTTSSSAQRSKATFQEKGRTGSTLPDW